MSYAYYNQIVIRLKYTPKYNIYKMYKIGIGIQKQIIVVNTCLIL